MTIYKSLGDLFNAKKKALDIEASKLPKQIAEEAVNFFTANFRRQGFLNVGVEKWKPRKREKYPTANTTKKDKESRGILVGKGTGIKLNRSVRAVRISKRRITIGSDRPYSKIHNEGGTIQHPGGTPFIVTKGGVLFMKKDGTYPAGTRFTKPHPITIPQRKFIGTSVTLNKKITNKIKKRLKKALT